MAGGALDVEGGALDVEGGSLGGVGRGIILDLSALKTEAVVVGERAEVPPLISVGVGCGDVLSAS